MEKSFLLATVKSWNPEEQRYEPGKPQELGVGTMIKFGGINLSLDAKTPIKDPLDKSSALVLRRPEGTKVPELFVYVFRPSFKEPKEFILGKRNLMVEVPFFYFSNLVDFMGIQIYKGNPSAHPEMLEVYSANAIGESPTSPLL